MYYQEKREKERGIKRSRNKDERMEQREKGGNEKTERKGRERKRE